jgi:trehalose 6-phosphate synthase
VTPVRDGMNLVAKEYVAAQNEDDPGVLILSRFAGAAMECKPALLVNPFDVDSVGSAIHRALSMSLDERCARHKALYGIVSSNDISAWPQKFLNALSRTDRNAQSSAPIDESPSGRVWPAGSAQHGAL